MPLIIKTSIHGTKKQKVLQNNLVVAWLTDNYIEGKIDANTANAISTSIQNNNSPGNGLPGGKVIKFETRKGEDPSGKILDFTYVSQKSEAFLGLNTSLKSIPNNEALDSVVLVKGKEKNLFQEIEFAAISLSFSKKDSSPTDPTNTEDLRSSIVAILKKEVNYSADDTIYFSSSNDFSTGTLNAEIKKITYTNAGGGACVTYTDVEIGLEGNGVNKYSVVKEVKSNGKACGCSQIKTLLSASVSPVTSDYLKLATLVGYKPTGLAVFYSKLVNSQISIDCTSLTGKAVYTTTNDLKYQNTYISQIEVEILSNKNPIGKKTIIKGSITGYGSPAKSTDLASNEKTKACVDGILREIQIICGVTATDIYETSKLKEITAFNFGSLNATSIKQDGVKAILTSIEININASAGSGTFSVTIDSSKLYSTLPKFLYLIKSKSNPQPVHWINSFLIVGGATKGQELMQASEQSRPKETIVKLDGVFMDGTFKDAITQFKDFLINAKSAGKFIKSASLNYNAEANSFNGSASFINDGTPHRAIKDADYKSTFITPT